MRKVKIEKREQLYRLTYTEREREREREREITLSIKVPTLQVFITKVRLRPTGNED